MIVLLAIQDSTFDPPWSTTMYSAAFNQPTRAAQAIGLRRLLGFIGFCFVLISLGCNADPHCRRETALMRAEILDIEDKYAALKSRYESTALALHQFTGDPIDQTMYGATSNYHDVILNEEIISGGEIISDGQIITNGGSYSTQVESYSPENVIYGTPVQSYSDHPGVIIHDPGTQLNAPQVFAAPTQNLGQPVQENLINETIDAGIIDPTSAPKSPFTPSQESLPLPSETRNQRDVTPNDFELQLPGQNRRTIPAIQASARLGKSHDNHRSTRNPNNPTEIVVNRSVTSGQDVNDSPGDDGLNLLLQTKDASGQIVLQAGELTVSLIDPKQRQRVGFWRFLAGETELFFVDKNENTDGILLHLPWDESVPRRARLLVHVSFVTEDGRTLTTSSDVLIKPPTADYSPEDPTVINWTQSDARWGDDGAYVHTDLESLEDSFRVESRQRSEEGWDRNQAKQRDSDWQRNGTYNRGARFSQSEEHEYSGDRDRDYDRVTKAADNPDQPKWRPVR